MRIYLHCARPGVVIGKGGEQIEQYRQTVEKMIGSLWPSTSWRSSRWTPTLSLVAENIAQQLEKRIGFRRAMKNAMGRAMRRAPAASRPRCPAVWAAPRSPAPSTITTAPSPLQTLRADIDYGFAEAATTYGRIGVKVWIYKGEVLTQTLRTTPRTIDTKNFKERSERPRRDRRDGDRRGGFNRNGGGFNRNGGRPQGGFNNNRPQGGANRPQGGARPAAPKEGGAN